MTHQDFVRTLRQRQRLIGTLIVSESPRWPGVVATLGLDWVFIDTEHVALDRRSLAWMCEAYAARGLPPVVRIPAPDPYQATMVLDGGAAGVIVPYVETVEQVRALVGAVKHRPIKGARLAQMLAGEVCQPAGLADYITSHNAAHALIVNIESVPAVDNLDDILAIDKLDGILIGPHDLSCSLGVPEQYDHPDFIQAVDDIIDRAAAAGKSVGIHVIYDGLEQEKRWIARGANLVLHQADIIAFVHHMKAAVAALRGGGASPLPAAHQNI